jgi:hypothetical protein
MAETTTPTTFIKDITEEFIKVHRTPLPLANIFIYTIKLVKCSGMGASAYIVKPIDTLLKNISSYEHTNQRFIAMRYNLEAALQSLILMDNKILVDILNYFESIKKKSNPLELFMKNKLGISSGADKKMDRALILFMLDKVSRHQEYFLLEKNSETSHMLPYILRNYYAEQKQGYQVEINHAQCYGFVYQAKNNRSATKGTVSIEPSHIKVMVDFSPTS